MLRFVIWLVLVLALWMLLRLILLSFRSRPRSEAGNVVIEMPARIVHPLQLTSYRFRNFDHRTGPPDPQRFCERLYLELSSSDDANIRKKYTLLVASPAGLDDYMRSEKRAFQFGRNLLLVEKYDMEVILRAVTRHLDELGALAEEAP